jgi:hypothetical protein
MITRIPLKYKAPDRERITRLVDALFERASTECLDAPLDLGSTDVLATGTRFSSGAEASATLIAARAVFFNPSDYSNWKTTNWTEPNRGRQLTTTQKLIDIFSGENLGTHTRKAQGYKTQTAKAIFRFWCTSTLDDGRPLNDVRTRLVEQLKIYEADLRDVKKQWLNDRSHAEFLDNANALSSARSDGLKTHFYSGIHLDPQSENTAALLQALDAAKKPGRGHLPMLGPLEFRFPLLGLSPLASEQKKALYGVLSREKALPLTTLGYVVLGLPVQRTLALRLVDLVTNSSNSFSSHTIWAGPAQGKSIALAQALTGISGVEGHLSFWNFDAKRRLRFGLEKGAGIDRLFELLYRIGQMPRRVTFVFDDLSKRQSEDLYELQKFHEFCRLYAGREGVPISFLFSSDSPEVSMSKDTSELKLEPDDEERLFYELTEGRPTIVEKGNYNSLHELLRVNHAKPYYKDDIHSFVDFVMANSVPIKEAQVSWFGDVRNLSPVEESALAIVSVAQLVDLPMPMNIAESMVGVANNRSCVEARRAIEQSKRIYRQEKNEEYGWSGLRLSAPHRARSILSLLGLCDREFVKSTFSEMIYWSLARAHDDFPAWNVQESEYIRHIFQRLGRNWRYDIPSVHEKKAIADHLFAQYGEEIVHCLRRVTDPASLSKWAGTIASLDCFDGTDVDGEWFGIIEDLCTRAVEAYVGKGLTDARAFVPLMRATNRLLRKLGRSDHSFDAVAEKLSGMAEMDKLIRSAASRDDLNRNRRANEALHCYAEFIFLHRKRRGVAPYRELLSLYEQAERDFAPQGLRLDAGNAIRRAKSVPKRNVELQAQYLMDAVIAIQSQIRIEGPWISTVDNLVTRFEREHGPLESCREPAGV